VTPTPGTPDDTHRSGSATRLRVAALVLVAVGLMLRTWQYSADLSLWLDEIAVARNVIERPLGRLLFAPLDYDQTAPKGFLLAEAVAVSLAGPSEYALRAWPWLASMASVVLFWRLAMRALPAFGGVAALLCFATAAPLIRQSGEVKQYGTDVAVAILLMLLALPGESPRPRDLAAGMLGGLAVWFSQPATIVALALAGVLVLDAFGRDGGRGLGECRWRVGLWVGNAVLAAGAALATMTPETSAYMKRYWAGGFPHLSVSAWVQSRWPWVPLREMFGDGVPAFQNTLFYPVAWLYAGLAVTGLALLARRRRIGWVVVAPVVATALAALAQQYPFRDRVILFLLPSLLLGFAAALEAALLQLARLHRVAGLAVGVPLLAGVVVPIVRMPPPYNFGDIKPVMSALRDAGTLTTAIYVHANGGTPFDYYAPRFGFEDGAYDLGTCHFASGSGRDFLAELDRYRGAADLWVVIAHMTPGVIGQRDDLLRYLDTIGTRRRTIAVPSRMMGGDRLPAEAFQYDLSDRRRLEAASADTFELRGAYVRPRQTCEEGPIRASTVDRRPPARRAAMPPGSR
jgi:hypothetical protein